MGKWPLASCMSMVGACHWTTPRRWAGTVRRPIRETATRRTSLEPCTRVVWVYRAIFSKRASGSAKPGAAEAKQDPCSARPSAPTHSSVPSAVEPVPPRRTQAVDEIVEGFFSGGSRAWRPSPEISRRPQRFIGSQGDDRPAGRPIITPR
jgi:hypothetical protein